METARLILRPLNEDDMNSLLGILADAEVMKHALYGRPLLGEEARSFVETNFARGPSDITKFGVVCLRKENTPVGFAGILPCPYMTGELELGFTLMSSAQCQGFATELGKEFFRCVR
jgi:RimJ/RimL family protein N-acetyltransferase